MALTYSEMIPLGKNAPKFELSGIDGKTYSSSDFKDKKALVVMFICVHCPYVVATQDRIASLAKKFTPKGIQFIGINSNDTDQYPQDAPDNMIKQSKDVGFDFPYLVDDTQAVARSFGAVCTPDIFVFDHNQRLVYRGRIDDSWKDPSKVTQHDLHDALEALVQSKQVSNKQMPSMGCSIKWRPNEL